jgi:hypothetical protein
MMFSSSRCSHYETMNDCRIKKFEQ